MKKQWPCSKCGFACASTWRSEHVSGPVICKQCRSNGCVSQVVADHPPNQVTDGEKSSQSGNSSLKISPSGSTPENIPFTFGEAGMMFGNLPLGVNLGIPKPLQGQEPKQKSIAGDDHVSIGLQNHFYGGTGFNISDAFQMNFEDDYEHLFGEPENPSLWDSNNVNRRRRSKLPQYTPSPIERFVNQLYHAAHDSVLNNASGNEDNAPVDENPKYDDVLIYEKCKFIPENEIGLGCMLLAPPVSSTKDKPQPATASAKSFTPGSSSASKNDFNPEASNTSAKSLIPGCSTSTNDPMPADPPTDDEDDASCLFDVPIRSTSEKKGVRGEASPSHKVTTRLRSLEDIYSHAPAPEEETTSEIKTTDKGKRPRGRPRVQKPQDSDSESSDEIPILDTSSLVDVPASYSFDESIDLSTFVECDVEILFSDMGERMSLMNLNDLN